VRRVLIVEDDDAMAVALRDGFRFEGWDVELARDGQAGLQLATAGDFQLVLLDVMLPRTSGLDVCRALRRSGSKVPIIMLTARGQEIDKVLGLKHGADDYVTKPFSFLELLARVEALLRRCGGAALPAETYRFGDVELDFTRLEARKGGRVLELSHREFELLRFLVENRNRVLSRDRLLERVWGLDRQVETRSVDVHVGRLRGKLGHVGRQIETVIGMGYRFVEEPSSVERESDW
jgi:DNA-binding response OmpR family regulator